MATPSQYNIDLANRQIQVNEWAYNNKTDTLFVFQLLFISLMFVTILLVIKGMGHIGGDFVWYSMTVLIIINAMIIINRAVYTNTKRDSKLWNKKRFSGDNGTKSPITMGDKSYQAYIDSVRSKYGPTATTGAAGAAGTGTMGSGTAGSGGRCVCPTPINCC